jgi:hypothetical protein
MTERALSEDAEIQLKLTTSSKPVSVPRERHRQQVLGTDFNYEDFRFWRPLSGLLPRQREPVTKDAFGRFSFSLARDGREGTAKVMLVGRSDGEILQFVSDELEGKRFWQVSAWTPLHPPSPQQITLSRLGGRFTSRMELVDLKRPADALIDSLDLNDHLRICEYFSTLPAVDTEVATPHCN